MLPQGLIAITRNQLLAMPINVLPDRSGKKRSDEWKREHQEAMDNEKRIQDTLRKWMNMEDLDAVVVFTVLDMSSSRLGHSQYMQTGPSRTYQLQDITSQSKLDPREGPSCVSYYAQHYCPSRRFIRQAIGLKDLPVFNYGPFAISCIETGIVGSPYSWRSEQYPNTEVYEAGRTGTPARVIAYTNFDELMDRLDSMECCTAPFGELIHCH